MAAVVAEAMEAAVAEGGDLAPVLEINAYHYLKLHILIF